MVEFLLSFVILSLIVAGMAIGVIYGREPISGTCGGLNNLGVEGACEICGDDPSKCTSESQSSGNGKFYNAAD